MKTENYKILIGEGAEEAVIYAAETLQKYVLKICGAKMDITTEAIERVFSLGETAVNNGALREERLFSVRDDGFVIDRAGETVIIDALKGRGVIYGVYEYLERFLGARFLSARCEVLPELKTFILPEGRLVSNPDFKMRTYLVGDTFQKTADFDHISRSRVFDLYTRVSARYGGENPVYGRNVNHNFHCYVPFEKYGNEHPEFYRCVYINEEILPEPDITNGITEDGLLDDSKELSVAKIVIEELKRDIIAHPEAEVFNFTQEDGGFYFDDEHNRALEKKYKRSGILIRFCNVVIRELNKWTKAKLGKTVKLMTFAYSYTKEAPVRYENGKPVPVDETVIADDNLIIQMAFFGNGRGYFSPEQDDTVSRGFNEWRVIGRDFWFWAYDANFYRYPTFINSFDDIQDNVRGFYDLGISYLCIQGVHESVSNWQALMRGYVYRKLMWDRTLCAKTLLAEFADLYFGAGAEGVWEMIELYKKNFAERTAIIKDKSVSVHSMDHKAEFYPEEMLFAALDIIERAEEKVRSAALSEELKTAYLKHLANVKCTPLLALYDNFYDYHPDGSDEEYKACERNFFEAAEFGEVDFIGERWNLTQYRGEGAASKVRRDREAEEAKNKELYE